jgi:sulfoquinovosidase
MGASSVYKLDVYRSLPNSWWLGSCLAVFACSVDGSDPSGARAFTLSDGTSVEVSHDGRVEIVRDGRTVFSMADDARPILRRYEESYGGGLGLWSIHRSDERQVPHDLLAAAELDGDVVRITYGSGDASELNLSISVHRPGEAVRIALSPTVDDYDSLSLPLRCDPEGSFFGFGEQYNGSNQRGEAFSLWVTEQGIGRDPARPSLPINGGPHTTYFPMPYYLDARGFGGLFLTDHRVDVDLCRSDAAVAWFETTEPRQELLVFTGPTPYDVVRQLGDEVGRPTKPPAWAWLPWLAGQGGQESVEAQLEALLVAEIPVGAMWVQDWTGIRRNFDGGFGVEYRWAVDDELYPDLAGFIDRLHQLGIRFLGYANPFVDPKLQHHGPMAEQGLLIRNAAGEPYDFLAPNGFSSMPDLTNPAARAYTHEHLRAMVTEFGMDGWMADFGEWLPLDAVLFDGSDPLGYHNRYPVDWHAVSRAVMDEVRPDGDWAVFARSGWTGVHRHAQIYWAGDQEADFEHTDGLPTVVPALLNLGMAGIPFVTHDIAGFSGGPSTQELFMRWTELGAFTPIMRTHDGNDKVHNWRWNRDDETTAHFRRFARIHVALAPEISGWADEAAASSKPIVRHLMLEFPDDPGSHAVDDQFLLGDTILVAPVVTEGARSRSVYLPPGTWFHLWTGERHEGSKTLEVDAPIGSPPVFTRDADRPDLRAID